MIRDRLILTIKDEGIIEVNWIEAGYVRKPYYLNKDMRLTVSGAMSRPLDVEVKYA